MSIAENEAREEFWNEYGLQAMMLRTAYVTGRTAEPCKEQVEAVAKYLADTSDDWNTLTKDDADRLGGIMIGWIVWHRKDGTVKHICPECAEKEVM